MNINLNNISRCRFVCMLFFVLVYIFCIFRRSRSLVLLINAAAVVISYRIFEYALDIVVVVVVVVVAVVCLLHIHMHIGVCVRLRLARSPIALNNAYVIHNCERSTKRFNILLSFVFISFSRVVRFFSLFFHFISIAMMIILMFFLLLFTKDMTFQ